MKKIFCVVLIIMTVLTGCSVGSGSSATISDYFPKKYNSYYEYSITGHSLQDQKTYNNYINGNRIQRITSSGVNKMSEVLEFTEGELKYIGGYGSFFFNDITDMAQIEYALIMKEPLKNGTKWQQDAATDSEITNMEAKIETPLGSYTAMEITSTVHRPATETQAEVNYVFKEYYVKDIGLVKTDTYMSGAETPTVTVALSKLTEKTSVQFPVHFFYPGNELLDVEDHIITVATNMNFFEWLETEMKNPTNTELIPLLTPNAKINKITYDDAKSLVTVDISKHFTDEISVGESLEAAVLKGIAYTLGYMYQVSNVEILIDGKNYDSGQMKLKAGEYIQVE